jgi:3-hydroxybutyryl-CoA dehydrogenase
MAEIRRAAVIGCGLMGSGIAEVVARAGYETIVREVNEQLAERGRSTVARSLERAVAKQKLSKEEADHALGRIRITTALNDLADADLVIEAVTEDLETKNEIFMILDRVCPPETILCSNTSSLNITQIAAATQTPERVVGMHFFNPVPVMKLVEVVRTIATSADTFERTMQFARSLGKEPIEAKDNSGFIVNRLLVPYMLDAIRALENGVGSVEDIDRGMTLGTGHPMGPFVLGDFVGLDTLFRISEIMFNEYREARFAPPPLLRRMIALGHFGRKTGRGFYDYSTDKPVPLKLT